MLEGQRESQGFLVTDRTLYFADKPSDKTILMVFEEVIE
jgi:hypothetical protein